MMKDISSFIRLKYEIITSNSDTWHLCEIYPAEVRSKWAWRCASDVEYLTKGYPEAEECIRVAKKYREGLATKEELDAAGAGGMKASWFDGCAKDAVLAAINAVRFEHDNDGINAAFSADAAAHAGRFKLGGAYATKWKLYIEWLIEELCEWELKQ